MSYAHMLRQQAQWIEEALDPSTPETLRIDLGDIGTNELREAADEIERLHSANERIGMWLSAALDDSGVCEEMKNDIRAWFDAQAKTTT